MKEAKKKLRKQLLKQRQNLTGTQWQAKSQQICQQLQNSSLVTNSQTVLSYFSFRNEPDLSSLWQQLKAKKWGFPRCIDNELNWHYWQPKQPLKNNQYNIPEPLTTAVIITPQEVDLILVPTVACDRNGYRLGYGGGYYDRLLNNPLWHNIPTVGITFDFAFLDRIPIESWDIQLNFICTESSFKKVATN